MLDDIVRLPNGARFYRCDLHTHTPMDKRFHCDGWPLDTEEQKHAFARHLVHHVRVERGLDILGVTEHNDVTWLPYIQQAASEVGLIVFPGVEIGAMAGHKTIHFLALFSPGTPAEHIHHWLSSIGLVPGERFHHDGTPRVVQHHTQKLTESIHQQQNGYSAIAIAAHASGPNGLFYSLEGEARVLAYNDPRILAVEIPDTRERLPRFERQLVSGELLNAYGPKRVACLNHSDGRCITDRDGLVAIGSRTTYIKLSSPSVEGLRQAFLDHESRVRLLSERNDHHFPRIVGVMVDGGFLRSEGDGPFKLHLNPNLNCVIGGRGAGKSALIELIRYAFALTPKADANAKHATELLRHVVRVGTTVTIFYETDDGTCYRIERGWQQPPRVYDAFTGEEKVGLQPIHLIENGAIEVYGQKEIYEISKDPVFQLRLLDNYITEELRPTIDKETTLLRQLTTNAEEVSRLSGELADWEGKLQRLPAFQEELARLERQDFISRLERKKQFDREKRLFDEAAGSVTALATQLTAFLTEHGIDADALNDGDRADLPHTALIEKQRLLLDEVETTFREALSELPARLRAIWEKGSAERAAWEQEYREAEVEYQRLIREMPNASAERYVTLQQALDNLGNLARRAEEHRTRLGDLALQRQKLLSQLRSLRQDEAFRIRQTKVQEMQSALGETLRLNVIQQGNRTAYAEHLRKALTGSGVTNAIIETIVAAQEPTSQYFDPIHLVTAIRQEREGLSDDTSVLAIIYKVSQNYRRRLAGLSDEVLYELETFSVPDTFVIELRVGERYRPLNELSVGQKCTAILSLILLERKVPLIIDQPEDDLDNRFIFDDIVRTLRREKERRQFIVATHNANIPVSGDAELIIVLDADEQSGWIPCLGSIDDAHIRGPVESILEGGREAFRIRKEKYGIS